MFWFWVFMAGALGVTVGFTLGIAAATATIREAKQMMDLAIREMDSAITKWDEIYDMLDEKDRRAASIFDTSRERE